MVEILPGIHKVDGVNSNTYLVLEDNGTLTLVDSGLSSGGKKVLDYVRINFSKQPSDVKLIVLTHPHIDHVRGARAIKKATGAKVAIHEQDAVYLAGKKRLSMPRGLTGFLFRFFMVFFRSPQVEADIMLKGSEQLPGSSLKVVHTPGHTPGSITLYDPQRKTVFVGDAIISNAGKLKEPPKQFTVDMSEARRSIEIISTLDFEILLSGHGDPVTSGGSQKVREFYASMEK
jgi:glyoxylase-like metal-dependent hydrolase (beta-lactamase superfamily II)